MTQSQNISVLTDWWKQHHDFGGHVYVIYDRYKLSKCEEYLSELQWKYNQISDDQKHAFVESDIIDNSMPGRDVLEDAAKITMLVNAYREEQMNFHIQVIQEPWKDRWRVHPGSGRFAAQWICGVLMPKMIYIHFNEPDFLLPERGLKIVSTEQFINEIRFQNKQADIDFQTYYAFPTNQEDQKYTQDRDHEWNPPYSTDIPWQFLRYTEGKYFLDYKADWRNYVFDFDLDKLRNS